MLISSVTPVLSQVGIAKPGPFVQKRIFGFGKSKPCFRIHTVFWSVCKAKAEKYIHMQQVLAVQF